VKAPYTCEICRGREAAELPCPSCGRYACEKCWLGSICVVCAAHSPAHTLFPDESGVAYVRGLRRFAFVAWITVAIVLPPIGLIVGLTLLIIDRRPWRKRIGRAMCIASLISGVVIRFLLR